MPQGTRYKTQVQAAPRHGAHGTGQDRRNETTAEIGKPFPIIGRETPALTRHYSASLTWYTMCVYSGAAYANKTYMNDAETVMGIH